jgi:hypothetical protein
MNHGSGTHNSDWEQQQEQLSAYLDGELSPAERDALEQHLPACAQCQAALVELRQVRGLLRALPAPALPRAFLLPEEGAVPEPMHRPQPAAPSPRRRPQAPHSRNLARAAQWAGSLAAAVGLLIVLGSALASAGPQRFAASAASTTNGGAAAPATYDRNKAETPARTPNDSTQQHTGTGTPTYNAAGAATPSGTSTSTSTSTSTPATSSVPETTSSPFSPGVPIAPLTGGVLLVGGAGLFVGGRIANRRRS